MGKWKIDFLILINKNKKNFLFATILELYWWCDGVRGQLHAVYAITDVRIFLFLLFQY